MIRRLLLSVVLLCTLSGSLLAQQTEGFSIDTISDAVFQRMLGRSFPADCTVKRQELRHLHVLHRNAQDSICQGELVCHKRIAHDLIDIFQQLFQAHYPIERIRLIDDYDANDECSMTDNNSSCFCFRSVAGTRKLSKHAQGLAIDINTLYNPCVRWRNGRQTVEPAAGEPYADRTKSFPYKIEAGDLLHTLFLQHGFTWGGSWQSLKDYQHFEKP